MINKELLQKVIELYHYNFNENNFSASKIEREWFCIDSLFFVILLLVELVASFEMWDEIENEFFIKCSVCEDIVTILVVYKSNIFSNDSFSCSLSSMFSTL